jgi:hypothetical protein
VRLAFRFNAADGPIITFQQWLFLRSDVDRIRANAKRLAVSRLKMHRRRRLAYRPSQQQHSQTGLCGAN